MYVNGIFSTCFACGFLIAIYRLGNELWADCWAKKTSFGTKGRRWDDLTPCVQVRGCTINGISLLI